MVDPAASGIAPLRALARASVPHFSDYCGIAAISSGRTEYLLEYPAEEQRPEWARMLRTPVPIPAPYGQPGVQVVLLHWWRDRSRPSLPDAVTALELADLALPLLAAAAARGAIARQRLRAAS